MTTGNVVVDVLSQLPKPALDVRCGSGGSGCRLGQPRRQGVPDEPPLPPYCPRTRSTLSYGLIPSWNSRD